jgi:hypothetical protein
MQGVGYIRDHDLMLNLKQVNSWNIQVTQDALDIRVWAAIVGAGNRRTA